MPSEPRSKRRVVVRSDILDSKGKMLAEELHRGLSVIMIVYAQDAKACRLVNCRERVEALPCSSNAGRECLFFRNWPQVMTVKKWWLVKCWHGRPLEFEGSEKRFLEEWIADVVRSLLQIVQVS